MKDRGKRTAMDRRSDDVSFYYSTPSEFSCRKHPSVSAVGICPYCLNDRLVSLVCSECGEQRLSSCSCSDFSPNRTSNAAEDAGNVVRISSLIDEETTKQMKTAATEKSRKTEEVVVFKRSSSSCVEIKRKNHRFSKIGRFFRKINLKKEKDFGVKSVYGIDEKNNNDSWVLDYNNDGKKLGVSRSRSLCSFRGGNGYFIGSEEDGSSYSGARSSFSAARSSSVNGGLGIFETTEHRKSNFEGRKSNFSETTETRKSNFSESEPPRRSCFEARKSNFSETEYPRRSNFSETEYNRRVNPVTATENNHPRMSNYEAARKSNFSETTTENRKSNFSESEPPRRSCFEARKSNFSETEYNRRVNPVTATENNHPRWSNYEAARKSNFNETTTTTTTTEQHRKIDSAAMNFTRRVLSMKESYFTGGEEPGFIDLKFDSSGGGGEVVANDGVLEHGGGGSCRLTTKDREVSKSRRSFKGWKWIFGHHHLLRHHQRDS